MLPPPNVLLAPLPLITPQIQQVTLHDVGSSSDQETITPLFSLQQTQAACFLHQLYQRGIINHLGRIIVDVSNLNLPLQSNDQIQTLEQFLSREFLIECGEKQTFLNYLVHSLISLGVLNSEGTLIESLPINPTKEKVINKQRFLLHQIVQMLLERNLINSEGKLLFHQSEELSAYSCDFNPILQKFFNKEDIILQIGNSYYCSCYTSKLDLCRIIHNNLSLKINDIVLFGGQARRRLLQSTEFCTIALHKLFQFLQQDATDPLIPPKKLSSAHDFHEVPDTDIKFLVPGATSKDHLYGCTDKIIEIFSFRFFNSNDNHQINWLKSNLFIKLNVKSVGFNEFAIAAFGKHGNEQLEFLFVNRMLREFVFTDEIEEPIKDLVKGVNKIHSFSSLNLNGWQSLIDNQGNIFHLDNAHQMDVHLFYHIITRMIRGKLFCSAGDFKKIINHTLEKNRYATVIKDYQEKDILSLISDVIRANIKHHHPFALPHAPLAYAFTASNFLQQHFSNQNIKTIFSLIFTDYSLADLEKTTFPLLKNIADAIKHELPFSILSAVMNFAGLLRLGCYHSNDSDALNIKIEEIEELPILHFELKDTNQHKISLWNSVSWSFENLFNFITDPNLSETHLKVIENLIDEVLIQTYSENSKTPILLHYNAIRTITTVPIIIKQAMSMLNLSQNRFCRYLGYFNLLTLDLNNSPESYISELLYHFTDALTFRKNLTIKTIIYKQFIYTIEQTKYRAAKQHINKFYDSNVNEKNSKKILTSWIVTLIDSGEVLFCKTAFDLWKKYSGHLEKTYEDVTKNLFNNLVNIALPYARELIKYTQNHKRLSFNIELEALTTLLELPESKGTDLLYLSESVTQLFSHPAPANAPQESKKFLKAFESLIQALIKENDFSTCVKLLVSGELQGKIPINNRLWFELYLHTFKSSNNAFADDLADLIVDTQRWKSWEINENYPHMWFQLCRILCNKNDISEAFELWKKLSTLFCLSTEHQNNLFDILLMIIKRYHDKSTLQAASFLLKENSILTKTVNTKKLTSTINTIIEQLSTKLASIEELTMAFNLLEMQEDLECFLWIQCLESTVVNKNARLSDHAWTSFYRSFSEKQSENTDDAALCWYSAIDVLNHTSTPDFLTVCNDAINPESKLSLSVKSNIHHFYKIKIWQRILFSFIKSFQKQDPDLLNEKISALLDVLPAYDDVDFGCLYELLILDQQLLSMILKIETFKTTSYILWSRVSKLLESNIEFLIPDTAKTIISQNIKNIFFTAFDIIYDRSIFHGQHLLNYAHTIISHPKARQRLGDSDYSYHLGHYLITKIYYQDRINDPINKCNCFLTLLDHIPLLVHNKYIENLCLKKCIELSVGIIEQESFIYLDFLVFHFFTRLASKDIESETLTQDAIGMFLHNEEPNLLFYFFQDLAAKTKGYYNFRINLIENVRIPVLECCKENLADNKLTIFRDQFFKYMFMLLNKFLQSKAHTQNLLIINIFLFDNIVALTEAFPKNSTKLLKLIHLFIFGTPIPTFIFYEGHTKSCKILIDLALQHNIYHDYPELMTEALVYIRETKSLPLTVISKQSYQENIYKVIHHLINHKTIHAAIIGLNILEDVLTVFNQLLEISKFQNEFIQLIQASRQMFYSTAFDLIDKNIKHSEVTFCNRAFEVFFRVPKSVDFLFKFFEIAFEEYQKKSLTPNVPYSNYGKIFYWFFNHFCFIRFDNHPQTHKRYYQFLNTILSCVTKDLLQHDLVIEHVKSMLTLIFVPKSKLAKPAQRMRDALFTKFLKELNMHNSARIKEININILGICEILNTQNPMNLDMKGIRQQLKKYLTE